MFRFIPPLAVLLLSACKPPATDDYVTRIDLDRQRGPSAPIVSPDTENALWASPGEDNRIIYGTPGETPLMAIECLTRDGPPAIELTRFVRADPEAKAMLALIGNGHVKRVPVDAHWTGRAWLWRGAFPAESEQLDVFTGTRQIEATAPGAGTVVLNADPLPARLLSVCRELADTLRRDREPDRPADPA